MKTSKLADFGLIGICCRVGGITSQNIYVCSGRDWDGLKDTGIEKKDIYTVEKEA